VATDNVRYRGAWSGARTVRTDLCPSGRSFHDTPAALRRTPQLRRVEGLQCINRLRRLALRSHLRNRRTILSGGSRGDRKLLLDGFDGADPNRPRDRRRYRRAEGHPSGLVPTGPARTAVNGFASRLDCRHGGFSDPMAWRSPLMRSGCDLHSGHGSYEAVVLFRRPLPVRLRFSG
jgi:hypothetical protein